MIIFFVSFRRMYGIAMKICYCCSRFSGLRGLIVLSPKVTNIQCQHGYELWSVLLFSWRVYSNFKYEQGLVMYWSLSWKKDWEKVLYFSLFILFVLRNMSIVLKFPFVRDCLQSGNCNDLACRLTKMTIYF